MTIRFGKLPPKIDRRTIKLSSILRKELLPALPDYYNIDKYLNIQDNFMFANDIYGDCVIAARAHQTLRFETYEQGIQPHISDEEVIKQYLKETGGEDRGLILLLSLVRWRSNGWVVGGKTYNIHAFASVDWKNHDEVKHCIHLLGGVNFGMDVYSTDIEQFDNNEIWELTPSSGEYLGGHGVYTYAYGYDGEGLLCMTWGKKQKMTWDFWDARVDEAYGIVDNRDEWLDNSPIDVELLDSYLREITGDSGEPSECVFSQGLVKVLNILWWLAGRKTRFIAVVPN